MEEKRNESFNGEQLRGGEENNNRLECVATPVDYNSITLVNIWKFLVFSAIGIWVFFVPVTFGGTTAVSMVLLIDAVKGLMGGILNWLVMAICVTLSITFTLSQVKKDSIFSGFHEKDGWFTGLLYYLAAIFAVMLIFEIGPEQILNPEVGGLSIDLAGNVLFTVTIAGWLVTLLIEFGILEFIGTLMEPVMRIAFKLPGQSAVTAVSAFVAAPAVGVFMTNKLYNENVYTEKEACCVATNFSVVSLGFFALLVSITGTVEMYGKVAVSSLIITFILAAIVIRIPPLSKKKDRYANGMEQTPEMRAAGRYSRDIFKKAFAAATTKASKTPMSVFVTSVPDVVSFAVKIVAFVQAIAVISLLISKYTPFFTWVGAPMIPYLQLMGMPDAAAIAPATLVGIAEITLPVLTIAGQNIAPMSIFFVIVLSTVQIIFFTESANAMLQSDIGLNFLDLVFIFLIRTLIAIPIVAAFAHLLF